MVDSSKARLALSVGALGIVFGDIGTSPLYALRECFAPGRGIGLDADNVIGVVSVLFWALSLIVCVKYVLIVLNADNRGEGGILALVSLVSGAFRSDKKGRKLAFAAILGVLGAALLYSDGIITPAISVLSAMEGLEELAPGMQKYVVPLSLAILVALFLVQSKGTRSIGRFFGPLLAFWFLVIGALGLFSIVGHPGILAALNPGRAVGFLATHGKTGFVLMGAIFLAMTGGEVLYADMAHFGKAPIRRAWFSLVYPALMLNYLGQGAFLLGSGGQVKNLFFLLAPDWALLPLVCLAAAATVIASQAVITGAFSLASQSVQLGFLPRILVRHTSRETKGQVYVPLVNAMLMLGIIALVLGFGESGKLSNAYGIANSATMLITTCLMIYVALRIWKVPAYFVVPLALVFLSIDLTFFAANTVKLFTGGWVVIALMSVIFVTMKTWLDGRSLFRKKMSSFRIEPEVFAESLFLNPPTRIPGCAVFLTGDPKGVPKALLHNLKHNRILHASTLIVSVQTLEAPSVDDSERSSVVDLGGGLRHVVLRYGYSEMPDVPLALAALDIPGLEPRKAAFFVGREAIVLKRGRSGNMAHWRKRFYMYMFGNALNATDFFRLPPNNVIEIGSQTEL